MPAAAQQARWESLSSARRLRSECLRNAMLHLSSGTAQNLCLWPGRRQGSRFVRGRSSEVKEIQETLRRAVIRDCSTKTSLVKC